MRHSFVLIFGLLLAALLSMGTRCSRPSREFLIANRKPMAHLEVKTRKLKDQQDFRADVVIFHFNEPFSGASQMELSPDYLQSSNLVLRVSDLTGDLVPPIPSSVPCEDLATRPSLLLNGEESDTLHLEGLAVEPSQLPPGTYRVRFVGEVMINEGGKSERLTLQSNSVEIKLK